MVVGRNRTLAAPTTVRARSRYVLVGRRRCAVGAGTPLAVLAALRPSIGLRDYGTCSRSARDAAGLYVFRIGPDVAAGRDGWEYKVNGRAGTAGAGDPRGSFGDGRRLRARDRVLWFWCHADRVGRCQRSLTIHAPTAARTGDRLRVTVTGEDDRGQGVPVGGATVRLAGASATTGADGVATLEVPAHPGRAPIEATDAGLVPAFPLELAVS